MAYTAEQKAQAVEVIRKSGGTLDAVSVSAVRKLLNAPGLSLSTLHGWLKSAPIVSVGSETKIENRNEKPKAPESVDGEPLDILFENVARDFLAKANDEAKIEKSSSKDLVTAAAIAVDKMRLLRDLPTEIIGAIPELTELANFLREENIEMSTAIRDWRQRLKAKKELRGNVANG